MGQANRYPVKKMATMLTVGVLLGAGMGAFESNALQRGPRVMREGDSVHRQAMQELETKPFDTELFAGLDSWTSGQALDAQSIEGKVVLFSLVSVNDKKSMMMLSSLARMNRQFGERGLVTLAVHPEDGWDLLQEKIDAGRVKVQVAKDIGGAFAEAIGADDYPDLFLIDRAGQLRYADIEKKSLKGAVAGLLKETPEEAIANGVIQAQQAEAAAQAEELAEKADEKHVLTAADYAKANWPSFNKGTIKAKNMQGMRLPVNLGNEKWLTEKVETQGKVLVLDFWATWCGPCRRASPILDQLQQDHKDQLAVLAISGQHDPEQDVRKYVASTKHSYSHLYDGQQSIYRKMEIRAIPHTLILSTDGIIRWQGNPLNPGFKAALEKVIEVDPMFVDDQGMSDEDD